MLVRKVGGLEGKGVGERVNWSVGEIVGVRTGSRECMNAGCPDGIAVNCIEVGCLELTVGESVTDPSDGFLLSCTVGDEVVSTLG